MCDRELPMSESWPGVREALVTRDPQLPEAQRTAQRQGLVAAARQALLALTYPTSTSAEWRESVREELAQALDREPRA